MAYLRGEHYVYENCDGFLFFDGVHLNPDLFDIVAVMRINEKKPEELKKLIEKAVDMGGLNFGCSSLEKRYDQIDGLDYLYISIKIPEQLPNLKGEELSSIIYYFINILNSEERRKVTGY